MENKKMTRREAINILVDNYKKYAQRHSNKFTLTPYVKEYIGKDPRDVFPKFTLDNALEFGALEEHDHWWPETDTFGGRYDFLIWLHGQYEDDDTEI